MAQRLAVPAAFTAAKAGVATVIMGGASSGTTARERTTNAPLLSSDIQL